MALQRNSGRNLRAGTKAEVAPLQCAVLWIDGLSTRPIQGALRQQTLTAGLEGLMKQITRRRALIFGLLGPSVFMAGCLGDDSSDVAIDAGSPETPAPSTPSPSPSPGPTPAPAPTPTPTPPSAGPWSVSPSPYFLSGTGMTFDLAVTLPTGVKRGGTFGVSSQGAPLPSGMTLSATGLLSVGAASAGRVDGVIFTYAEPVG